MAEFTSRIAAVWATLPSADRIAILGHDSQQLSEAEVVTVTKILAQSRKNQLSSRSA